ncbi:hypothetical protein GCM10028793_17220 [Nocardiopsis oceani]
MFVHVGPTEVCAVDLASNGADSGHLSDSSATACSAGGRYHACDLRHTKGPEGQPADEMTP